MSARTIESVLSNANPFWARFVILLASTMTGIAYGVLGDMAAGGVSVTHREILASLLFSPLAVPIGGQVVTLAPIAFTIGGLAFWPVYAFLAWKWLRTGRVWLAFALLFWCAQGFFQVIHRLEMMMGV